MTLYPDPSAAPTPTRFGKGLFGWVLFIFLAITLIFLLKNQQQQTPGIPLGSLTDHLHRGDIAWLDIGKDYLTGEFSSPHTINNQSVTRFHCPLPEGTTANWAFTQWLLDNANDTRVGVAPPTDSTFTNILVPIIPWILIFGFIYVFVFRQLRTANRNPATTPPLRVVIVGHDPTSPK